MMQSREAHVAGKHHCQNELIHRHDPGLPLHLQRFRHQLLESEFLQQCAHGEQASVGGQILAVKVIGRGRPDLIGLRRCRTNPLHDGRWAAILWLVVHRLGGS